MDFSFDLHLFASTFGLIFIAEIPDKTAFATLLLATRSHPLAVFIGVALAFLVQSLVAVSFGSALGLLPHWLVHGGAALMFFVFAWLAWRRIGSEDHAEKEARGSQGFGKTILSSFMVIFIAEWGDLTQLATAALTAKYRMPLTIFCSATLALWSVTAVAIFVGHKVTQHVSQRLIQKVAAFAFCIVGIVLLIDAIRDYGRPMTSEQKSKTTTPVEMALRK